MKEIIVRALIKATKLKRHEIESLVEIPPNPKLGDYAFPCFELVKKLKKNPGEIARELAEKIKPEKEISKIKVVDAYINFFINKKTLAESVVRKILKEKENYGRKKENRKIVIDFSGPNIGKPLHVGHIRSSVLGDSLKKIFEFLGNKTIGINYLGDTGLHIGKLIVAHKLWGNAKKIEENPQKELLNLYVKFCKKEKISAEQELEKFLKREERKKYLENEWTKRARKELEKLEKNDKENKKIWKKIKKYSIKGFLKTYKILDIEFNEITGQSKFSNVGKKVVEIALSKGIATRNKKGKITAKLKKDNLPNKIILRGNGTALYSTQDLGAAVARYKKYKFDRMIYVVGFEQQLYFKQIFKILEKLGYKWSKNLVHLPFGLLSLEQGRISSREGRVVFLQDVIDRVKILALKEINAKNPKLKNKEKAAEKIGLAALKYSILSKEPIKTSKFSFKQALSFEGDTGPYLQYSYVRASSIIRKAKKQLTTNFNISGLTENEIELVKKLSGFPEIVNKAKEDLNPSLITNYGFNLCQEFNKFYHICPVIDSKFELFRVALVEAFKIVVRKILYLLGIKPLEKM